MQIIIILKGEVQKDYYFHHRDFLKISKEHKIHCKAISYSPLNQDHIVIDKLGLSLAIY